MAAFRAESAEALCGRGLRAALAAWLGDEPFERGLARILALPPRRVVSPLIGLFCSREALLRWRAVVAVGAAAARLAEEDPESARVVMRRLLWNLNDESGGIGWGCAEALGEAAARSPRLAAEYGRLIVSFLDPAAAFIDHPGLQVGVLWALDRLAATRPVLAAPAGPFLSPFLEAGDPARRGHAARAARRIDPLGHAHRLARLASDGARLLWFDGARLFETTVAALAAAGPPAPAGGGGKENHGVDG
ncbi:MAG: DVU0298 family protein [Desulfobacterales bacterium]